MKHHFYFWLTASFLVASFVHAQVFTLNPSAETDKVHAEISPSREVVPSEKIKNLGVMSPSDVLKESSQLQVIGSSTFGQTRSIVVRGTPSSYTSIFWNGVRLNDWLTPSANAEAWQGGQEFSSQVQIVKGPQTLRASSSSIAGIIEYKYDADEKFIQLAGTDKNIHRESFEYFHQGAQSLTGMGGVFFQSDYASAFDRQKLMASQKDKDLEKDRFQIRSGSLLQTYNWSSRTQLQMLVHQQTGLSNDDWGSSDDPNATTFRSNQIYSASLKFDLHSWESHLRWDHQINEIDSENPEDAADTSRSFSKSEGISDRLKWSMEKTWKPNEVRHNLSVGLESITENGWFYDNSFGQTSEFNRDKASTELYGIHGLELENLSLSYGGRTSLQNSAFQAQLQPHFAHGVSPYLMVGSGYKDPSLYQLYSTYGNRGLSGENSRSVEVGVQWRNAEGDEVQAGLFRYEFENLINYNSATLKYENIEKSKSEGVEFLAGSRELSPTPTLELKSELSYQRLESINLKAQQRLVRVPQDSMKFFLQMNPERPINSSLTIRYIGPREDYDIASKKNLPAVTLLHLSTRWKIDTENEVSVRIENIANQPYEEIWGYTPTGRLFVLIFRRVL